ncbi:MAG: aminotransferase class V-fold PLP-dependent enzyme, partial [Planctomycetaceae bacterium]|nr:aminotransferase class V-fold PLP-dependent enzyme [Planctomycetaceae bacterium]
MTNSLRRPIYCDNAATSFPKPPGVQEAVVRAINELGVAAGRGVYRRAQEVDREIQRTRLLIGRLFNVSASQVVFTQNATGALNQVLHGFLQPGEHVVTSEIEHNSVLRPLKWLEENRQVEVTYVGANQQGIVSAEEVAGAVTKRTKLITLMHASNVTGAIQPIEKVGEFARSKGIHFLVDAAQSAGYLPIDLGKLPVDFLACAGHKGLLGPLGMGVLIVHQGLEANLAPLLQGGTGSMSEDPHQPTIMPDRFESGNLNVPGIMGLGAGVEYLLEQGIEKERERLSDLTTLFLSEISGYSGLTLYGPPAGEGRVGVISLNLDSVDPQTLATILDQSFEIEVRSGLHCAPGAHRACGSLERGGTVRFSFGHFTKEEDV